MTGETLFYATLAVLLVGAWVKERVEPGVRGLVGRVRERREPSPVEQLHEEYVSGAIDEAELEQRLTDALDERAEAIREEVETVDGVGPSRAAEVADAFESVEAVRRASVDELREVEHVGEVNAERIRAHFQ